MEVNLIYIFFKKNFSVQSFYSYCFLCVCLGRHQQIVELDCPEGYVCRLNRGVIYKVTTSVATHSSESLPLLAATWRAKASSRFDSFSKINCILL